MNCMPMNAAVRRYNRRFFTAMGLYVLLILLSVFVLKHHPPAPAFAYLLAFLPSIPLVAVLVIVARYIDEEKDEFQRAVLLESMLWALGCVLAVSSVWGLLEMLDNVPRLPVFFVFPAFWALMGLANAVIRMRYRMGGPNE